MYCSSIQTNFYCSKFYQDKENSLLSNFVCQNWCLFNLVSRWFGDVEIRVNLILLSYLEGWSLVRLFDWCLMIVYEFKTWSIKNKYLYLEWFAIILKSNSDIHFPFFLWGNLKAVCMFVFSSMENKKFNFLSFH